VKLTVAVHAGDVVCITAFAKVFYPGMRYCDLIEGGDQPLNNQQRMVGVFRSVQEYRQDAVIQSRLQHFKKLESYFPVHVRPALCAWALQKDPKSSGHFRELQWFVEQLEEMETEHHSLRYLLLESVPIVGYILATCRKCKQSKPKQCTYLADDDMVDEQRHRGSQPLGAQQGVHTALLDVPIASTEFVAGANADITEHTASHGDKDCGTQQRTCSMCLDHRVSATRAELQLFFLGNATRKYMSLLFALCSCYLILYYLIQWFIDTDNTLQKHGASHSKCIESRNVQAIWWIAYIGIYATFVLVLAPLIAACNSNNCSLFHPCGPRSNGHRPLFLATRELGRPARDEDTNEFAPESEGGAYQVVRVALEHLTRYRAATSYTSGTVIHVERELDGVKSVVRATIKRVSGQTVCIQYPDNTVDQNKPKGDLKMPTLELPSKSKRYDDGLQPEMVLGRTDLKLTQAEANRLVEFVSLRRRNPRDQLVATVILDPDSGRLKDILDPATKCLFEACEERRCAVSRRGDDNSVKRQLHLEELMDLITGLSSIMPYQWLLLVSWLLTMSAIVLDSSTFPQVLHDGDSGESLNRGILTEHKWIVRLLIYYFVVLGVYPLLKAMRYRGCLACLEPCAGRIRSMKRGLFGQRQAQQAQLLGPIEMEGVGGRIKDLSLWGASEPEPEMELSLPESRAPPVY
jgi:hypothetical protein